MRNIDIIKPMEITIDGQLYYPKIGYVHEPDMMTDDHGIFLFQAQTDVEGGCQGIQIILDDPNPNKLKDPLENEQKGIRRRIGRGRSMELIQDYIDFFKASTFQNASGTTYILYEEKHDGYIRGLMSIDMNRVFIFKDYFDKEDLK